MKQSISCELSSVSRPSVGRSSERTAKLPLLSFVDNCSIIVKKLSWNASLSNFVLLADYWERYGLMCSLWCGLRIWRRNCFLMFSTKRKLSRVSIFWSVCSFKGQSKLIVDVNKILLCKGLCNASSIVRLTISSTPRIILQNFTNIIFSNDTNQ